jgi:hypothetical protein
MENEYLFDARWLRVPRRGSGQWLKVYVTLNKKGAIVIGSVTHRQLGSPEAYVIHLEPYNDRIALQPATLDTEDAYPARVTGSRGAKVLRVRRLVSDYGICPPDTVEFIDAKVERNGALVLDLKKIRISPKAHSQCRKSHKIVGEKEIDSRGNEA